MRSLSQNALLLTVVVALGCGDSTIPRFPVTYVLESVNHQPLPFSLGVTDIFRDRYMILSGTLTLHGNRIAVLVDNRREPDGVDRTKEVTYTAEYPFGIFDNRITIDSCTNEPNCTDLDGDFTGATIELATLGGICPGICIYGYRRE